MGYLLWHYSSFQYDFFSETFQVSFKYLKIEQVLLRHMFLFFIQIFKNHKGQRSSKIQDMF